MQEEEPISGTRYVLATVGEYDPDQGIGIRGLLLLEAVKFQKLGMIATARGVMREIAYLDEMLGKKRAA
jgi:hypothetical protein